MPTPIKVVQRQFLDTWYYPEDTLVSVKQGQVESVVKPLTDATRSLEQIVALFGEADEVMRTPGNQPISYVWNQQGWTVVIANAPKRKFEGWFIPAPKEPEIQQ